MNISKIVEALNRLNKQIEDIDKVVRVKQSKRIVITEQEHADGEITAIAQTKLTINLHAISDVKI